MRLILSTAIYCFSSVVASTTVAPAIEERPTEDPFSTPTRRPKPIEDLWAPNGWYDGSERDREEYMRQFRPESPVVPVMRTPERPTRQMSTPWAPRAPKGSRPAYDGLEEDRDAYLSNFVLDEWTGSTLNTTVAPMGTIGSFGLAHTPTRPARRSADTEAPWAPRRGYSGLARDRPEYLSRFGDINIADDEPFGIPAGLRTPERRPAVEVEAPWAPNGDYNGSSADRAAYLLRFRNEDSTTSTSPAPAGSTTLRGRESNDKNDRATKRKRLSGF